MKVLPSSTTYSDDCYQIKGVTYHSLNYKLRKNSASHLAFLCDGQFVEIVSFDKVHDSVFVIVKEYKSVPFIQYFSNVLSSVNLDAYQLLQGIDNSLSVKFFNVIDWSSSSVKRLCVKNLLCKALHLRCTLFDESVDVVTPILNVGEHK